MNRYIIWVLDGAMKLCAMGITGAASLREDTMKSIAFMFPHAIMRQVQLDDEPPQPNNVMRSRHHTLQQL